jgi:hypothetical protein
MAAMQIECNKTKEAPNKTSNTTDNSEFYPPDNRE